jgi:hypothetical protein
MSTEEECFEVVVVEEIKEIFIPVCMDDYSQHKSFFVKI